MSEDPWKSPGPIRTAVIEGRFDHVHLLSNYPESVHKPFAKWLGVKPVIHSVDLADPTDYEGIFYCTNRILSEVTEKFATKERSKLCILLSPGTPAMAVVLVLLGKSRFPATFYQTGQGKLREAKIPAGLFEDVLPDLIRDRDIAFQHLAYDFRITSFQIIERRKMLPRMLMAVCMLFATFVPRIHATDPEPDYSALVVGVGTDPPTKSKKLPGAEPDAIELAQTLIDRGFRKKNVTLLTNSGGATDDPRFTPTADNIRVQQQTKCACIFQRFSR